MDAELQCEVIQRVVSLEVEQQLDLLAKARSSHFLRRLVQGILCQASLQRVSRLLVSTARST